MATITVQPTSQYSEAGGSFTFSITATGTGTLQYAWYVDSVAVDTTQNPSAATDTFILAAEASTPFSLVYCIVSDDTVEADTSNTVTAIVTLIPISKHSLIWNYNNNTFSWKDPAVEDSGTLFDTKYQSYGFSPGFQQRWEDWKDGAYLASTWEDDTTTAWSDTLSKSNEREMISISRSQGYKNEQQTNSAGSAKRYFVERTQIDFDRLAQGFTSDKIKKTKRFVVDVQADPEQIALGQTSEVDFYVGWALNLMEPPNYKSATTFRLQERSRNGSYKLDYRSSGRYMGMYFDLTDGGQLSLTGGEVDVDQTSGR